MPKVTKQNLLKNQGPGVLDFTLYFVYLQITIQQIDLYKNGIHRELSKTPHLK